MYIHRGIYDTSVLHTHIHVYIYVYTYTHPNVYTCTHIYMYIHIYTSTYMCICIYICDAQPNVRQFSVNKNTLKKNSQLTCPQL